MENVNPETLSQKSIYSQLLTYTTRFKWYILCLFLAVIMSFVHLTSGILVSYHLDQLNRYVFLGIRTEWCSISIPFFVPELCNRELEGYFQ